MAGNPSDTRDVRPFRWEGREFDELPDHAGGRDPGMPGAPEIVLSPEERAQRLLAEARADAEAAVGAAQAEAADIREQARLEGMAEGRAEAVTTVAEAAGRLQAVAEELAGYKESLYAEARDQVVELTLALVGKLLGPLAASIPAAVVPVVERSLQMLSDREQLTIRVNPDDLKVVLDAKPQLLEAVDGIQKLTVLEDPSVRPGGCLVQTPTTEIDARLETQLQELARSVRSL